MIFRKLGSALRTLRKAACVLGDVGDAVRYILGIRPGSVPDRILEAGETIDKVADKIEAPAPGSKK